MTTKYDDDVQFNQASNLYAAQGVFSPLYLGKTTLTFAEVTKSALSGATVTATGLIPAGAFCLGITCRVITLITGATTFTIGDGTTADLWGTGILLTVGTVTSGTDWKSTWAPKYYKSAQDVVLTGTGGSFSAGAVHLVAHILQFAGPTQ